MGYRKQGALQSAAAFYRLCVAWYYWTYPAAADGHAHRLHDRARARIRHPLPTDGHVPAAQPDRDRENSALSRDFNSAHSFYHRRRRLAFSCSVPSAPHAGGDLFTLSALLAWVGRAHFRLVTHPDTSDPDLGFLSAPGLHSFGCLRPAGPASTSYPIPFGMLSANPFLSGVSLRKSV